MTPEQAINCSRLKEATRLLAACPDFGPRIRWWAQYAHSSERWLQFEWAYRLEHVVRPDFAAVCEYCRLDICLVNAASAPFRQAQAAAGIELKWWQNWWVDDAAVRDLQIDLNKVDTAPYPAVALLLFLLVDPVESDPEIAWISDQIRKGQGVTGIPALRQRLSSLRAPHFDFQVPMACSSSFGSASLWGFAFCNNLARVDGGP